MNKYKDLDTSKLNYVIYCRKSSEGEDKQIQSLETQLRELEESAKRNGLNIVEVINESKSAFKVGREGFARMTTLIRNGKANAILVVRANRISRNPIDAGYVISLMDEKKLLYIRTPHSTCYTCSSTDKMMIALELIFSKKDSDDKGDMVKEGQKTKALKGTPHGVASLGFLNDKSEDKGNRKWMVDELKLAQIKVVLDMFLSGAYSAGKLHKYAVEILKLSTVKRKHIGGQLIQLSRIYEILKDPIYAGFFFYDGERYELNANLPRLITEAQHNKIKALLTKAHIPKIQHHDTAYSGFISSPEGEFIGQDVKFQLICDCKNKFAHRSKTHCPNCGIEIEKMEHPKLLSYTWHYNVKAKKAKKPYKTIRGKDIDEKMEEFVVDHLQFSDELVAWSKQYIHEMKEKEVSHKILFNQQQEQRKNELHEKKSNLRAKFRDGKFTEDEYNEDLEGLGKEYCDVGAPAQEGIDWYARMMEISDITKRIASIFKSDNVEAKRKMLSSLGSNLIWDSQKLLIHSDKAIEKLIEGVRRIKSVYPKFEPRNYVASQGSNEKTEPKDPVFSMMLPGQDSNLRPID